MIRDMHMADTRENALKAYDKFVETFEAKYEKAVENLKKDKEDLFRFYDYPAEHWTHIRTSNPIESTFATVRLRHNSTKGNGTAKATEAMAFKLCQQAEKGWRRLKGFEKLELVVKDKKFENGVLKEAALNLDRFNLQSTTFDNFSYSYFTFNWSLSTGDLQNHSSPPDLKL